VFPDGRTAYIPSDGRPLPGYELALADIKKHGHAASPVALASADGSGSPFAKLLGLLKPGQQPQPDADEDGEVETASIAAPAGSAKHYFPSSSGPAQTAAPAQKVPAAALPPPAPAPAADKLQNPLLAALEREAARKRELAGLYAQAPVPAPAAAQPATYELASYEQIPVGRAPQRVAAATPDATASNGLTATQVIAARGAWSGLPDAQVAAQPAQQQNPLRNGVPHPARKDVVAANAAVAGTGAGSSNSWAATRAQEHAQDRVPPELALAYATQPEQDGAAAPSPVANVTRAAIVPRSQPVRLAANLPAPPPGTTIAVKRTATQPFSTILAAPTRGTAPASGARFDNPWLRAVLLSPSVRRYLSTLLLGDPDYRMLAALMQKPASSAMMTFAADPNPGLTADRFSGSAVVFISTVTWGARTASLR
jgi:hypothetical protein